MGRATLTPIRRRNPKVSAALSRAIERALALEPEERFQTMSEFAAALAASGSATSQANTKGYHYLDRTVVPAAKTVVRSSPAPAFGPRPGRRRWPIYGLVIGTIVTIAAGAVYALPGLSRGRETPLATTGESPPTLAGGSGDGTTVATQSGTSGSPTSTVANVVQPTQALAPTPTPPGGGIGQLAFASNRDGLPQVYIMNIDGTGVRKVTDLSDGACQPAWSPDGMRLAFTSPCRANRSLYAGSSIWIINVDGTGRRALASAPGGDFDPAWSPGGDRVAFTSLEDGHPQIYVMSADGKGRTNLSNNRASDSDPSWSPNGSQIIFTSVRDKVAEVWIMPVGGGSPSRYSRSGGREDSQPSWSPDGKYVAFDQVVGGVSRLVAMQFKDSDSPESRICPEGPLSVQPMAEPVWSPDGQWLAFETWPTGGDHEIALVTSNCANYTELTSQTGLNFDAAWRP